MSKILIGLSVPSIEEHFDLFVPTDVPLAEFGIENGDHLVIF